MKKIIFMIVIMLSLTACGNKYIEEDIVENNIVQENVKLSNENNEVIEDNKESIENNEDKGVEKVEETIVEKDVPEVVECDEKQEVPGENQVEDKIMYEKGVEVGKKAIDFEVELLSGKKVKLSDYLGKPVFLNFWATWCGPCVGEMPDIEQIKAEYGDEIVILAINGGEPKNDVKSFIDKKGYTFNIGIDERGEVLTVYDSMYIPLSLFIDGDGIIQERNVGALSKTQMKEIVDKIVNKE